MTDPKAVFAPSPEPDPRPGLSAQPVPRPAPDPVPDPVPSPALGQVPDPVPSLAPDPLPDPENVFASDTDPDPKSGISASPVRLSAPDPVPDPARIRAADRAPDAEPDPASAVVAEALHLWGLSGHAVSLVAQRENLVYRIHAVQPLALRLHRQGMRSKAQLVSELDWMAALEARGLSVPRPHPALDGALCHMIEGRIVDVLGWLDGVPMGVGGHLNPAIDGPQAYRDLGQAMANLHRYSDDWSPPADFQRPAWDIGGLLGETPLWGRFWENPRLTPDQATLLTRARTTALARLQALQAPDYGLIHADLVQENVLIGPDLTTTGPHLIDFDDGGYGYRLFDMATVVNFILREPDPKPLQKAFTQGYLSVRAIDMAALPLFQTLRALTYVGWIVPRLSEPGADARHTRFVTLACHMAATLLT